MLLLTLIRQKRLQSGVDAHFSENGDTAVSFEERDIPTASQCMELLVESFGADSRLVSHSKKVAQTALRLAKTLNRNGLNLNLKLIEAASLLHDMARDRYDHAQVAAQFLRQRHWPRVAEIVEAHMKPYFLRPDAVTEVDVVSFCDRLVLGDRLIPLEARFRRKLLSHADDPETANIIQQKFDAARSAQAGFEKILGMNLEELFPELHGID